MSSYNTYVGDYDENFSTDLASMIYRELHMNEFRTPEELADTLERHANRLREDPPEVN